MNKLKVFAFIYAKDSQWNRVKIPDFSIGYFYAIQ